MAFYVLVSVNAVMCLLCVCLVGVCHACICFIYRVSISGWHKIVDVLFVVWILKLVPHLRQNFQMQT